MTWLTQRGLHIYLTVQYKLTKKGSSQCGHTYNGLRPCVPIFFLFAPLVQRCTMASFLHSGYANPLPLYQSSIHLVSPIYKRLLYSVDKRRITTFVRYGRNRLSQSRCLAARGPDFVCFSGFTFPLILMDWETHQGVW